MYYKFDTNSIKHARAALLLYALYRSRDKNSPLNGLETWDRFASFARGASLKSYTTSGFVQEFCRKAKIGSVKPRYLSTGEPVLIHETGELIRADGVNDYRLDILQDDTLMPLFSGESVYLIMLIRDRIQREKMEGTSDEETD